MASREGQRAVGTDGRDYAHREKVAAHYQRSAQIKKNLKYLLAVQSLVAAISLAVAILVIDITSILTVCGYLIGLPSCWYSLKSNSTNLINIYGVSSSLLGVFPMAFVIYSSFWTRGITSHYWLRLAHAVIVIAVNGVALYFAKELMLLWYPSSNRTTKKRKY